MNGPEAPEVLVVEDEPLVRMVAAEALRDAGYEVLEAEAAEEALGIIERERGISAVFSDVNMPGAMDGFELARRVRRLRPSMGIILASGRFGQSANGTRVDGALLLAKPYRVDAIAHLIHEVLA